MFEKPGSYLFKNKLCPNTKQVVCSWQGVLAQGKNGDEFFCKEKLHATNGKVTTCSQGALISFLRGGEGERRNFFPFSQWEGPRCLFFFLLSF